MRETLFPSCQNSTHCLRLSGVLPRGQEGQKDALWALPTHGPKVSTFTICPKVPDQALLAGLNKTRNASQPGTGSDRAHCHPSSCLLASPPLLWLCCRPPCGSTPFLTAELCPKQAPDPCPCVPSRQAAGSHFKSREGSCGVGGQRAPALRPSDEEAGC